MTFGQSPHATLDAIIRKARYLLISFDGPIRSISTGNPPAPHISDVLIACRESGRPVAAITTTPAAEVRAYLDIQDLSTQTMIIAPSIGEAVRTLGAPPTDYVSITSSPSEIEIAKAAGIPSIAYAKTLDDADHLVHAGANAFVYSMTDIALRLRLSIPPQ
jgi:phosphoglycolate phosphatase-like HAD superfamily hydrolase